MLRPAEHGKLKLLVTVPAVVVAMPPANAAAVVGVALVATALMATVAVMRRVGTRGRALLLMLPQRAGSLQAPF